MPRLTIGVPAFNNAGTLRTSIETLLVQRFTDYKIIISDDNSSDETQKLCLELARLDDRIEYIRQPVNLRYQNFNFLLQQADTEFFMWAAGDDRWHPDYVQACISELDKNPSLALAVSKVQFEEQGVATVLSSGTFPLVRTLQENLRKFLCSPNDNSRMYGVQRTRAGQQSFPSRTFHAYDWAFSAATLRFGGHGEIPEILMYRDRTPARRYLESIHTDASGMFERLFSLYPMSAWLLREKGIPHNRAILGPLIALNIDRHLAYSQLYAPRYYRLWRPVLGTWRTRIRWRLRGDRSEERTTQ